MTRIAHLVYCHEPLASWTAIGRFRRRRTWEEALRCPCGETIWVLRLAAAEYGVRLSSLPEIEH